LDTFRHRPRVGEALPDLLPAIGDGVGQVAGLVLREAAISAAASDERTRTARQSSLEIHLVPAVLLSATAALVENCVDCVEQFSACVPRYIQGTRQRQDSDHVLPLVLQCTELHHGSDLLPRT